MALIGDKVPALAAPALTGRVKRGDSPLATQFDRPPLCPTKDSDRGVQVRIYSLQSGLLVASVDAGAGAPCDCFDFAGGGPRPVAAVTAVVLGSASRADVSLHGLDNPAVEVAASCVDTLLVRVWDEVSAPKPEVDSDPESEVESDGAAQIPSLQVDEHRAV